MIAKTPILESASMTAAAEQPPSGSSPTGRPKGTLPKPSSNQLSNWWSRKSLVIAAFAIAAIILHLVLRFGFQTTAVISDSPLLLTLVLGGIPLLYDLLRKLLKRQFGSDLLGGISIITSVLLGEYLAGSIIVLMLSGGEALESYALRSASSVLKAVLNALRAAFPPRVIHDL